MTFDPASHKELRSSRWVDSLSALAKSRGDSEAVARRAVALTRQLNLAPWIALAIAEGAVSLTEARVLDRVGRCKALQAAILDKRRSLEELRVTLPYAAHFLAADVREARSDRKWDERVLIRILEGVLGRETKVGEEEEVSLRVRVKPLDEYVQDVERVLAIMERTHCDIDLALDVEAGRVVETFAADYVRQKRALEAEERRARADAAERVRFPARRPERPPRRPAFHRQESPPGAGSPPNDHWPRESRTSFPRDHWPK